mgnify:CR=1 FL=1
MDGVKLREVSAYDLSSDRTMYRWDVMTADRQAMFCVDRCLPGQLPMARARAREILKAGIASLPLVPGSRYV